MVMARSWTNCPAGSAATRSAQTTTPIAGRCEIVFSSEHCGAPNRTILEFSSQNSCQPCHRQRSLLEDLRHSSDKPPTEPNACQREGLFCFRHRWCYNIAMQRTLEWIKNQNFQGFGCSECNWKFKPVGALVGDSLDEMKRNYLAIVKESLLPMLCQPQKFHWSNRAGEKNRATCSYFRSSSRGRYTGNDIRPSSCFLRHSQTLFRARNARG